MSPGAGITRNVSFRVLAVASDSELAGSLVDLLEAERYEVLTASTGTGALDMCAAPIQPDLVVAALDLPDMAGTELCRQLRQAHEDFAIPFLLLDARADEIDRVVSFELGADDYVATPFDSRELSLRIRAILRRCYRGRHATRELRAGDLNMDRDSHRVRLASELLELTQIEFRILEVLMMRPGRPQSRDRLLEDVWWNTSAASARTIDTHIRRLREKLGSSAKCIRTVRGVGYAFVDPNLAYEDDEV